MYVPFVFGGREIGGVWGSVQPIFKADTSKEPAGFGEVWIIIQGVARIIFTIYGREDTVFRWTPLHPKAARQPLLSCL